MAKSKKNLFEMGSDLGDGWQSDNKSKQSSKEKTEIKTPDKHRLHFAREKRRGKTVTIVKPFFLEEDALKKLLKTLKSKLSTGGTVRNDTLEFQGEVQEPLRTLLGEQGYRFRI
ncbi:translation initiation factor SUI1 [Sulfurovum lithotrophicum]|uniref:Translation initiation factor SUI1 n=1 Tax=Sulfurovum lithotrophicum TaxID=206403 RepID=A0A7U4LZL9_9BACT|nr:translation initiation factor SUI1 [Sulfurovum lithotrophicum]AKF24158.1 translation initiation factor SUI1 [Sulfurovum lithotrophicum]